MNYGIIRFLSDFKPARLLAVFALAFTLAACGGGGDAQNNDDTTAPVITLLGTTPIDVEGGSVYTDAGATAVDDIDGDITASIVTVNPVNTAVVGTYTVTYDVDDSAGNSAVQVTRTVNVVAAGTVDTTPPVITLSGTTPIDVEVGSVYTDAGATAVDNVDGDITASIVTVNPVNTAVAGAYTVTYDVTDTARNSAVQVTRTVNVVAAGTVDTTPPVITLSGTTPIDVESGSVYTDAGATASDNVDGDITASIVTVNPVNTAVVGVYVITYDVDDVAGNSAVQITRTVNVVAAGTSDTTAPVITLSGTTPIDVEDGSVYTDAGATASDNVDGDITASIVTVNPVNTALLGTYTVTYDVDDAAGNSATQVTRTVNVVAADTSDTTAPVITLSGTTPIDVESGSVYTDAGATASDNVDGDITASIVTVNPVNTALLGTYTVTYDVDDAAGNSATQVTRTVNVVAAGTSDTTAPVITLLGTTPIGVEVGSVYTDAGTTALDDVDGNITASIVTVNPVDTAVAGAYTVTYDVDDAAGNSATQVTRTVNVVDTTPPTVNASSELPLDGATNVAANNSVITISATFSEPLATGSASGTTFTLEKTSDGSLVTGTAGLTAGDTTPTFKPDANLEYDTQYTARLTTGITDTAGNALAAEFSWSFTTAATALPAFAFYSNAPNWNDYVKNDGADIYSATNTAADGTETDGYSAVIHGGEMRSFKVPGINACGNLTATDALGAFDWTCDDSSGNAIMISTGLKDNKNLSDLLDFATPGWLDNSVTVTGTGAGLPFTTASTAWWSNPVTVDNDGGSLTDLGSDGIGEIYIVTSNPSAVFTMADSKLALVIQPGVTISGPGASGNVIYASTKNFLWMEGAIDATGDNTGVYWAAVEFSIIRNVSASNGYYGVSLYVYSDNNSLSNVTAANNVYYGVTLYGSSDNSLSNVTSANNGYYGVYLYSSSDNSLSNVTAANNGIYGVYLYNSSDSSLSNVTAANNVGNGVYLNSSSDNSLSNVTAANNGGSGVYLIASSNNNSLSNVTVANNGGIGVGIYNSSNNNSLSNVTSANNGTYGVWIYASSNNYFTGLLKVGNNSTSECLDNWGTTFSDINCTAVTPSDFALTQNVTLASSFVGKVTTDDTVNADDSIGTATYPTNPAAFDWTSFENIYRGWGIDGSAFPATDHQNKWASGTTGRIWDWSLSTNDTGIIRYAVTVLPTGDDAITHTWSDASTVTFLRNASEIMVTGGNDNGLCESGETCLFTPNIGSYQGHGALQSAGAFTDGTITSIILMQYPTNGY